MNIALISIARRATGALCLWATCLLAATAAVPVPLRVAEMVPAFVIAMEAMFSPA